MAIELHCLKCDEPIKVEEQDLFVKCPECKTEWQVDFDADFRDGSWHDLTKLVFPRGFKI